MDCLIIFAKYPEAGKVKTRLGSEIGYQLSALFYKKFLNMTLNLVKEACVDKTIIAFSPESGQSFFRGFIPTNYELYLQNGKDLGGKMSNSIGAAFAAGAKKVIVIGSDSPTLPHSIINEAIRLLNTNDVVLGPAEDGGYYLIGLNKPYQTLFKNVEWSTDSVLEQTIKKINGLKIKFDLLREWYDVDDINTLYRAKSDDSTGEIKELMMRYSAVF